MPCDNAPKIGGKGIIIIAGAKLYCTVQFFLLLGLAGLLVSTLIFSVIFW